MAKDRLGGKREKIPDELHAIFEKHLNKELPRKVEKRVGKLIDRVMEHLDKIEEEDRILENTGGMGITSKNHHQKELNNWFNEIKRKAIKK